MTKIAPAPKKVPHIRPITPQVAEQGTTHDVAIAVTLCPQESNTLVPDEPPILHPKLTKNGIMAFPCNPNFDIVPSNTYDIRAMYPTSSINPKTKLTPKTKQSICKANLVALRIASHKSASIKAGTPIEASPKDTPDCIALITTSIILIRGNAITSEAISPAKIIPIAKGFPPAAAGSKTIKFALYFFFCLWLGNRSSQNSIDPLKFAISS